MAPPVADSDAPAPRIPAREQRATSASGHGPMDWLPVTYFGALTVLAAVLLAFDYPHVPSWTLCSDCFNGDSSSGGTSGSATVAVPDVTGLPLPRARAELEHAGLKVGARQPEVTDASRDWGTVLRTSPPAGSPAHPGDQVMLVIGTKPAATSAVVPDVAGMTEEQARSALSDFVVAVATESAAGGPRPGTALRTVPAAGQSVPTGSHIELIVAAGTQTTRMPAEVGKSENAAGQELERLGLDVKLDYRISDAPEGTIIAQFPDPGTVLDPGEQVSITVAQARSPSPTPTSSSMPSLTPTP